MPLNFGFAGRASHRIVRVGRKLCFHVERPGCAGLAGTLNPAKLYKIHAGSRANVGFNFFMGRI